MGLSGSEYREEGKTSTRPCGSFPLHSELEFLGYLSLEMWLISCWLVREGVFGSE